MELLILIFVFLFGLGIGSFLNVLIWRLSDEKAPKFWQGRSICPKCKHQLSWKDNIPLLSYVLLGGKCRYCKKKISIQYPIVELTTAVTFTLTWYLLPFNFAVLALVAAFIVIFFADFEYQIIPDEMVAVIVFLATLLYLPNFEFIAINYFVGLLSALGFFLVVLATKFQGMGLGDVKLAFAMGVLLGFPAILVAIWNGFILGGIFAVFLLILRRRKIHETMALGPFLVLGTLIAALWSEKFLAIIGF